MQSAARNKKHFLDLAVGVLGDVVERSGIFVPANRPRAITFFTPRCDVLNVGEKFGSALEAKSGRRLDFDGVISHGLKCRCF